MTDLKSLVGRRALFEVCSVIGDREIRELKILEMTDRHIKIKYLSGFDDWLTLKSFDDEYAFLEELPSESLKSPHDGKETSV